MLPIGGLARFEPESTTIANPAPTQEMSTMSHTPTFARMLARMTVDELHDEYDWVAGDWPTNQQETSQRDYRLMRLHDELAERDIHWN